MAEIDRFFIVGAQRCGTTYLYRALAGHPEIEMAAPVRPEPKFFLDDDRFGKGLDHYDRTFFSGKPGARVRGEKSTSYLESEIAAQRIAEAFPAARIVAVLREPLARAVSHWRFSVQNGVETLPLEQALRREPERREAYDRARFSVSPFAYLKRGRYADDLERYRVRFGPDRLGVFLYERLVAEPSVLADLFRFLGVNPAFEPEGRGRRVNPTEKTPALDDTLSPAFAAELRAAFEEPNRRLEERFGLDLSPWRKAGAGQGGG